jgi:pimeloyl-ACP methyl ester carboxylesterase
MAHRFRLVEQFDLRGRLERVRVPALVLRGDRDLLVSDRSLHELCTGLPHARRVSLGDNGHLAFVTEPRRVAAEVSSFLSQVEYD